MSSNIVQLLKSREYGLKNRKFPKFKSEANHSDTYQPLSNANFLNFILYKTSNICAGHSTSYGKRHILVRTNDFSVVYSLLYKASKFHTIGRPLLSQCFLYARLFVTVFPSKYIDILLCYFPFHCELDEVAVRHMEASILKYPISPDCGYVNYGLLSQYNVYFFIETSTHYELLNVE